MIADRLGGQPNLASILTPRKRSCSLSCKLVFHKNYSQELSHSFIGELDHPRAMFFLIASMKLGIVRRSIFEHAEKDFEQSLPQAPQRAGVAHPLVAFLLVISLAPGTGFAKTIGPQVNGVTHEFVARPANAHFINLVPAIHWSTC